ncbi:hypothetical protein HS1genome_1461 [Sulfodiicoccus acidiphilus]|uniref:Uncharacterized protein n=1 Tax=Sulfodiicoccus acidiphilus TaxID=1670455 RepID=A0A348B4H0_9CREN|nr:hypothetical protein [Sulfodiicoccus acidiphilus]BBD73072.1 hypothetical protein HS1genome_1461 [Sulfodiicoccus acidiphilus]GGU04056.1 hypothetical protein GCM10007116_21070 [Sulfodiicoccus acidiphilus]
MGYALFSRSFVFTSLGLIPRMFGSDEWIFFSLAVGTNALGSLAGFLLYPALGRKLYLASSLGGLACLPFFPYSIPAAVFFVSLLNPLLTPLGVERGFTRELYFSFSSGFLLSSLFVYLKLLYPALIVSSVLVLALTGPEVRTTKLRDVVLAPPGPRMLWLMAVNFAVYGAFAVVLNRSSSLYVALFYVAVSASRLLSRRFRIDIATNLAVLGAAVGTFLLTNAGPLTLLIGFLYGPLHPLIAEEAGKLGDPLVTVNYAFSTDVAAGFLVPYLLQGGVAAAGWLVVTSLTLTSLIGLARRRRGK